MLKSIFYYIIYTVHLLQVSVVFVAILREMHYKGYVAKTFEPVWFNPLNTKRRPLYLKTQFVPRSKHFSSRL